MLMTHVYHSILNTFYMYKLYALYELYQLLQTAIVVLSFPSFFFIFEYDMLISGVLKETVFWLLCSCLSMLHFSLNLHVNNKSSANIFPLLQKLVQKQ